MDSMLQGVLNALTLAILLMVSGVEMNPGPVSVSCSWGAWGGADGWVRFRGAVGREGMHD
jgi:hypothetical protein